MKTNTRRYKMRKIKSIALTATLLLSMNAKAEYDFYVESDPIAFAFSGHSIHAGLETDRFRLQIGSFGTNLPDSFKDSEKFEVSFTGYGVKLDYFKDKEGGMFVGMTYSITEYEFEHIATQVNEVRDSNSLGLRLGYKYRLTDNFYVTPWIGVSKNLSDRSTIQLSGDDYQLDDWTIFPTIHLGYQF